MENDEKPIVLELLPLAGTPPDDMRDQGISMLARDPLRAQIMALDLGLEVKEVNLLIELVHVIGIKNLEDLLMTVSQLTEAQISERFTFPTKKKYLEYSRNDYPNFIAMELHHLSLDEFLDFISISYYIDEHRRKNGPLYSSDTRKRIFLRLKGSLCGKLEIKGILDFFGIEEKIEDDDFNIDDAHKNIEHALKLRTLAMAIGPTWEKIREGERAVLLGEAPTGNFPWDDSNKNYDTIIPKDDWKSAYLAVARLEISNGKHTDKALLTFVTERLIPIFLKNEKKKGMVENAIRILTAGELIDWEEVRTYLLRELE